MAWLKLQQSLRDHKKIIQLAEILDMPEPHVTGHCCYLWLWCIDNAGDGQLPDSIRVVEKAAAWEGERGTFFHALVSVGFIDQSDENYLIHDWNDHNGAYHDKKEAVNKRVKKHRDNKKNEQVNTVEDEGNRSTSVTQALQGVSQTLQSVTVTALDKIREEKIRKESTNYIHVADQSVVEIDPDDQDVADLETAPDGTGSVIKAVKRRSTYPDEFEEFWEIYPRRIEKTKAFRVWNARRKDGFTSDELSAAARHYAMQCQRDRRDDSKIKYAATFLGPDRAFEEYIARAPTETTKASTNALDAVFQVAQGLNGGGFD